MFTIVN